MVEDQLRPVRRRSADQRSTAPPSAALVPMKFADTFASVPSLVTLTPPTMRADPNVALCQRPPDHRAITIDDGGGQRLPARRTTATTKTSHAR